MSPVESSVWGTGERVVLVHGSLSTGPMTWEAQRPLADEGYQLVVPTRHAYSSQAAAVGEDFETDGADIAVLLADGAHLVGHSYGGLVAMVAASVRPEAVLSLVLAEPPVFEVAADHPEVARLRGQVESALREAPSDKEFLIAFLSAMGAPAEALPPGMVEELTELVPPQRLGRQPWSGDVPVESLAGAPYPKMVVSGNHHPALTAMCDRLADRIGAERSVVEGAGHEMQTMSDGFNTVLLELWRRAPDA